MCDPQTLDAQYMLELVNKISGSNEEKLAKIDDMIASLTFLTKIGKLKKPLREDLVGLKKLRVLMLKEINK